MYPYQRKSPRNLNLKTGTSQTQITWKISRSLNVEDSDKSILKLEFPKPIENKEISRTVHNNSWHLCEDGEEIDDRVYLTAGVHLPFSDTCSSVEEPTFSDDSHPLSLVTDKSQMSSRGDEIVKIGNEKSQSKNQHAMCLKTVIFLCGYCATDIHLVLQVKTPSPFSFAKGLHFAGREIEKI
ncbi:hypothetical protein CEXT_448781 [Caerostris extrusa]|uniref:Uncharacterized protein n=1 Tax=Caerostris extrusa TaxID=172846 RepID=A0AAV4V9H5_CAEEX|nr:hypothetical protein CEXT_448781 [Caerostris extrusa]